MHKYSLTAFQQTIENPLDLTLIKYTLTLYTLSYLILILTFLKLCFATAIQNLKGVKNMYLFLT